MKKMKTADKKFAFLIWIEIFSILIFANLETTKPFIRYMIFIFFLTVIYGYTRKNFINYFRIENNYVKAILGIGILFFLIALLLTAIT
jgi:hypothetical protein